MKILITGGTGFLGLAVCKRVYLHHEVYVLTRDKAKAEKILPHGVKVLSAEDDFPQIDAIFNFAGAAISAKILNHHRTRILLKSRLQILRLLAQKYSLHTLPRYFIQASATGIYSNDQTCDEKGECHGAFCELISAIEKASAKYFASCEHFSILRFGVILGKGGGLFSILKRLPRLRIIPDKNNCIPWVSLDDAVASCLFVLSHNIHGIINVADPKLLTANEILKIGRKTSFFLPLPYFLLTLVFDKRGLLLTASNHIISQKLLSCGFIFKHSIE